MKLWLAVAGLWLIPALAVAQTYRVQSGDHAGFSRLAILYRDIPEWELGRVSGGYELRPNRPTANYDLSRVFRKIGRNRIADVQARPDGRLFIAVECECYADAFEVAQGVIIDIRRGATPESARFETPLPDLAGSPEPSVAGANTAPPDRDEVAVDPAPAKPDNPSPLVIPVFDSAPIRTPFAWQNELALDLTPPGQTPDPGDEPVPLSPAQEERLARIQADLIAQISRAAGQGLIEADQSRVDAALESTRVDSAPETIEPDPVPEPELQVSEATGLDALESFENINIETAIDRGHGGPFGPTPMTADGIDCIDDDRLDLSTWGEPLENGADLGAFRDRIVGEFDQADPDGIAALVRNYIYLSFGLEARVALEAFDEDIPGMDLYYAMADIMDYGHTAVPGPLTDQLDCTNRAAMWSVLAQSTLKPSDSIARKDVIAAFSELPLHLRRHLGPWLVERFVGIGDTKTATAIRNAVARAPGSHGDELHLMEAEIAIETGEDAEAAKHLESVVAADGSLAPGALIRLIDTELDAGRNVPRKHRDNAAALAFSNRGTELGAELKRVQIRALAHGGAIGTALAELAAYRDGLTPDIAEQLKLEIYALAATGTPHEEFLKLVLPGPVPLGPSDEADTIRRAIAKRLIDFGLTEPALVLLSDDPSVPAPEDRLLYAQAYLLEQRPDLVIGYLAGLEMPKAKALRAQAHELAEEYARAATAYDELGDDAARNSAVWRSEDWAKAAGLASGIERDAATLASGSAATDVENPSLPGLPETVGPLGETRALVETSQETRRILEELLGDRSTAPES